MVFTVVAIVVIVAFVGGLAALYAWSRITDRDVSYPKRNKTQAEIDQAQLGIALNSNSSQLGGR